MSLKAWFLSWFRKGEPTDAAPSSPALYVAGPLTIERHGESYVVRQACGKNAKGEPMERSWSFASAEAMRRQLEEFGGAATAPELLAELQTVAPEELDLAPIAEPLDPALAALFPAEES